jgi:hypothetical protein
MPDLATYTVMRLHSAGGAPTLAMLEIANAAEVPAREMDSPAVRALTEMAIIIASWDNDLYSYHRERRQQGDAQNLVNVLAHHDGLTHEEAMARAVGLRDRVMRRFLQLREAARPGASEELRLYLTCLGHAIRGNLDWAMKAGRYHGMEFAGTSPGAPECVDRPSDDRTDPLPVAPIAWWWDRLVP